MMLGLGTGVGGREYFLKSVCGRACVILADDPGERQQAHIIGLYTCNIGLWWHVPSLRPDIIRLHIATYHAAPVRSPVQQRVQFQT